MRGVYSRSARRWVVGAMAWAAVWMAAMTAYAQDSDLLPVEDSYFWGAEDAPITIVMFSEFQCPFCGRAAPTMKQLEEKYPGKLRFVFKHHPLPFHPQAFGASEAALAAGEQGKFAEMHDLLFANQRALQRTDLEGYAQQLGLDMQRFRAGLDDGRFNEEIKRDMALADKVGARGTPTFFVNGRRLVGAQPFERFAESVDAELAALEKAADRSYRSRVAANYTEEPVRPPTGGGGVAPDPDTIYAVPVGKSAVRGEGKDAIVTIVIFSEFQCPFCGKVQATLKELESKYPGKVRFVFKHNPLAFHKDAKLAAVASLAAEEQGVFWTFHDLLFENQRALAYADLLDYAERAGIKNMRAFKDALDRPERYEARIKADQDLAKAIGAAGTPTFFINGRKLAGAQPIDAFVKAVDRAIEDAAPHTRKGLKGDKLYAALQKGAAATVPAPKAAIPAEATGKRVKIDLKGAPTQGSAKAPVTLAVFADFQCPYCARSHSTLNDLLETYDGKVRVAFIHNPLGFHKDALPAAIAAEAANKQGKFWPYAELLYANQRALSPEDLERYAAQAGLDVARFRQDRDDPALRKKVEANMAQAQKLGVTGTPTFFVNGRKLSGAQPFESFKALIDDELGPKKGR